MCDIGGIAMSCDTGPRKGCGYVLGWGRASIDDMQDGNWAGVARCTGSSCRGNLRLTSKLKIGEISEMVPKREMGAIG